MSDLSTTKANIYAESKPEIPLLWDAVSSLGLPLWMTDHESLRKLCQNLAARHYLVNRDPADAALFYILLGKKAFLASLYKLKGDLKLYGFLSNNFNELRWSHAADTNAYVLIQKRQFKMATAMCLLGGKLVTAIDVCLDKEKDYMLALFVAKLVSDLDGGVQERRVMDVGLNNARLSGDKHMESAILWLLEGYKSASALSTVLLEPEHYVDNGTDCSINDDGYDELKTAFDNVLLSLPTYSPDSKCVVNDDDLNDLKNRGASSIGSSSTDLSPRTFKNNPKQEDD